MRRVLQILAGASLVAGLPGNLAHAGESPLNPFRKHGTVATDSPPASDADLDALQLSGISMIGTDHLFNLVDTRTQRSFWIPLKGTGNGFTVTAFNRDSDEVVVKRGKFSRTIALRKSVLIAPAQPRASVPPATPPVVSSMPPLDELPKEGVSELKDPKTPAEIKQAEFEARMMVSDLLEISMRERERARANREGRQPPEK